MNTRRLAATLSWAARVVVMTAIVAGGLTSCCTGHKPYVERVTWQPVCTHCGKWHQCSPRPHGRSYETDDARPVGWRLVR